MIICMLVMVEVMWSNYHFLCTSPHCSHVMDTSSASRRQKNMFLPNNIVAPPKKSYIVSQKWYPWLNWVGATGDLCLKIDNGLALGYFWVHHNRFSFYSYTVLTLLFGLVTAASSKTIAAWSALSNLFSLDLGGLEFHQIFKLLCTDLC